MRLNAIGVPITCASLCCRDYETTSILVCRYSNGISSSNFCSTDGCGCDDTRLISRNFSWTLVKGSRNTCSTEPSVTILATICGRVFRTEVDGRVRLIYEYGT